MWQLNDSWPGKIAFVLSAGEEAHRCDCSHKLVNNRLLCECEQAASRIGVDLGLIPLYIDATEARIFHHQARA